MIRKIKTLYNYREMINNLVKKDLRGRYKSSVLGFLWTFINPLCQIIIYTFVFSSIFSMNIEKYYLFLTVVMIPWVFFSTSVAGGTMAIVSQQDLVKKIYFPREVLPISYVTSNFINMLYSFVVVFIVILLSGIGVNIIALMYLPLVMVIQYILVLGITMITSACNVYLRDLEHIVGVLMMAWIYLTPVMYDISFIPEKLRYIFYLNPMTPIAISYREILYYKNIPPITQLMGALIVAFILMVMGNIIFSYLEKSFVEEL